jgi:hypothetical protein
MLGALIALKARMVVPPLHPLSIIMAPGYLKKSNNSNLPF